MERKISDEARCAIEGAEGIRLRCEDELASASAEAKAWAERYMSLRATLANANDTIKRLTVPRPEEARDWSPAPGVRGRVLYERSGVLVAHVTIDPGAEVPREIHEDQEETLVSIAGQPSITIDRGPYETTCYLQTETTIGHGEAHLVRNESATETVELIAVLRRV